MTIRTLTCVVIVCDGCGYDGDTLDGDGPVHWHHRTEAARWMTGAGEGCGWDIPLTSAGGQDLCPQCVCRRDGHDWTAIDGDPEANAYCQRCITYELVPV